MLLSVHGNGARLRCETISFKNTDAGAPLEWNFNYIWIVCKRNVLSFVATWTVWSMRRLFFHIVWLSSADHAVSLFYCGRLLYISILCNFPPNDCVLILAQLRVMCGKTIESLKLRRIQQCNNDNSQRNVTYVIIVRIVTLVSFVLFFRYFICLFVVFRAQRPHHVRVVGRILLGLAKSATTKAESRCVWVGAWVLEQ